MSLPEFGEIRSAALSVSGRLFSRVGEVLKPPKYSEVYTEIGEPPDMIPVKENYKNGELIGRALLAYPLLLREKRYLEEEYTPSFAEGRCVIIGGGDYKTVVVDRDGDSDRVIKLYNEFRGEGAQEKAQATADKITIIHEIAGQVAPGYVLPGEMRVDYNNGVYAVCEVQQRADPMDIDLFDPKTAGRLHREATNVAIYGTKRVEEELLRRGLARKSLAHGMITDYLSLTEIHWDLITNHLVSLDIVDRVDIFPLLPPSLRNALFS